MKVPVCSGIVSMLLCLPFMSGAQTQTQPAADSTQYWKTKFNASVNLNQASFSSSWQSGGVNSIGLNSQVNFKANYAKDRHSWDNEIDLSYGFVNNEGQGFRKTVDRIFLDTKYGYELTKKWDIFTSLNFTSQFARGYSYDEDDQGDEVASLVSDILAPAYITSAWGAEYHPTDYFNVRISPFAPRVTIVERPERFTETVDEKPYGVKPPDNTRIEWAAFQLDANFNKEIFENINLKWRYLLYANYETLEWERIDHRLDIGLTAKVNKFVNVTLGAVVLYDYDQVDEVQFSQSFTLGFAYARQNYKEEKKK